MLLTSVAAPIISQGKLWGVVTSDISLAALQARINKIRPWEGSGYAMLLSSGGRVVSYPDQTQTAKPWQEKRMGSAVPLLNSMTPYWGKRR